MPAAPEWTRLADLPSDGLTLSSGQYGLRHRPSGAIINNKIYITGGYDWIGGVGSRNTYEYDIATNTFSAVRDGSNNLVLCPNAHVYGSGASLNGNFITFGGTGNSSYLDIYNPSTKTWTSGPLPTIVHSTNQNIGANECCVYNNKLYSFGGPAGPYFDDLNRGLIWNPAAASGSQWSFTSDWSGVWSGGLQRQALAVYGNKAYLFGGWQYSWPFYQEVNVVLIYNFDTNSWARGADAPTSFYEEQAGVIGNKIYVTIDGDTYIYDPVFDSWNLTPLESLFRLSGDNHAGYVSDGTNFYIFCGDRNLPSAQYPGYLANQNYHVLQRLAVATPRGPFVGAIVTV